MNFVKTTDFIEIFETELPSKKGKAYDVREIRKKYKNAYQPWTEEADNLLEINFCSGKSIKELSEFFGRNMGAIESRIAKLELNEKYG